MRPRALVLVSVLAAAAPAAPVVPAIVPAALLAACGAGGGNGGGATPSPSSSSSSSSSPASAPAPAPHAGTPAAPAGTPAPAGPSAPPAATSPAPPSPPAPDVWPVPPGWRSEVIKFPLDFAPSIAHRGFEDLRFPPGFFDPASGDYWSYAFIWRTEDPAQLDATALGAELTAYFRGLIAAVDQKRRISARDQIVARATPDGAARFRLSAHVFDAFKTAAPLDLSGIAERRPCRAGALWVFVLAPAATKIRPQLEELARAARCAN